MRTYRKISYLFVGLIPVVLITLYSIPVMVDYSVDATGIIVPAKEWTLRLTENGGLQSILRDNRSGSVIQSAVYEIERGDAVNMRFADEILERSFVRCGDTVCQITSSMLALTLAEKLGELAIAEMQIPVAVTGEKDAVIHEAKDKLSYAEQQVALQRNKHARTKELFAKELISQEEFETSRDELRLLEINAGVARAQLNAVTTGLKPEEVALMKTNISALREDVSAIQMMVNNQYQISPINGMLIRPEGEDTVLQVYDTGDAGLLISIPWENLKYVKKGTRVFFLDADGKKTAADICTIEKYPRVWGRKQVTFAYAQIVTPRILSEASMNLVLGCKIRCERVRLGIMLQRDLFSFLGLS